MQPERNDVLLLKPNVERDASFALGWFSQAEGECYKDQNGLVWQNVKYDSPAVSLLT